MRTFRIFFNSIRRLSFRKIVRLLSLVVPHPLFSLLSFYATLKAYSIAQNRFPDTASGNGVGNAFRHALWCCLIMMYCSKISSPQKALDFCKRLTDMHEELFPNEPLETKMDLHNNKIGMDYFMELLPGIHRQFFEKGFFVDALIKKSQSAKVLTSLDDDFQGDLVYLQDK